MNKQVPQLRFKEFSDVWQQKQLKDLRNKNDKYSFTGGPFGPDLKSDDYTSKGVRIIQLQNILDGSFNNEYKIYTSEKKANELSSSLIFPGEIIISKMADPLARATIVPNYENKYLMASDGIRLSLNNFNNTYFVMLNINNYRFRHSAERKATGSTRKRIGLNVLGNLAIFTPTLKEQQKIGQFFNKLDDLITLHTKRLKLLKKKRKAYLQKLFPKNGKVIPRMRFKGFNDIWQSYKLSDLYTFKKGKNMSWNALNISEKYPAIIYPELYTKYSDNITKIFSRSDIEGTYRRNIRK